MAYGRYLLTHHTLIPDHTIYSWTPADGRLIYCAWITEILLYLLYQAGGLFALFVFRYLCLLLFIFLFWRQAVKYQVARYPLTWLVCLLSMLMIDQAVYLKPEIFSYVLISLTVWTWFEIKISKNGGWRLCYLFPLYMLLWVNSHGAFIFGLTYLGCLGIGELLNGYLSPQAKFEPKKRKHFFISLFLSGVCVFLTPYGWKYPSQLVSNLFLGGLDIQDYKMVNAYSSIFDQSVWALHYVYYLILAVCIISCLIWPTIKTRKYDFTLILSNCVFCWLFTHFLRTTYFWGVIFPFSSLSLLSTYPELSFQNHKKHLRLLVQSIIVTVLLIVAAINIYEPIFNLYAYRWFGFGVSYINPVEESAFIKQNLAGLRLGNDYDTGGYLLWDLWPETKIFIDPRYFPFRDWFAEYCLFVAGKDPAFLEKFPCDVWCLNIKYPVVDYFLHSKEWKLVHYGPSACIFVKNNIPVSDHLKFAAESLAHIKSLPQAATAFKFAIKIGDVTTAQKIIAGIKYFSFIPAHRFLIAQAYNCLGNHLLTRNENNQEVLDYFLRALRLSPGFADVHSNLGTLYYLQQNPQQAIAQYREALRLKPDNPDYAFNLAMVLLSQGDPEQAIPLFKKSLSLKPAQSRVHFLLGNIYSDENDWIQAIKHYSEALRINPDFEMARNKLEKLLNSPVPADVSMGNIRDALKADPTNPYFYYLSGALYELNDDLISAIEQYNKAMSLKPNFLQGLSRLVIIYYKKHDYETAAIYLKNIIELQPELAAPYYNFACLLALQNKKEESVHWLQLAINKGYHNWETIKTDRDLDNIRDSSEYKNLVQHH